MTQYFGFTPEEYAHIILDVTFKSDNTQEIIEDRSRNRNLAILSILRPTIEKKKLHTKTIENVLYELTELLNNPPPFIRNILLSADFKKRIEQSQTTPTASSLRGGRTRRKKLKSKKSLKR